MRPQADGPPLAGTNRSRARSWTAPFGPAVRRDPFRLVLFFALGAASALLPGCGGAHAPCPTPTSEVDRHREESLAVERNVKAAFSEDRSLRAKRDEAASRIAAAEAALDSIKTAGGAE
jgi:hypothetical protein